MLTIRNEIPADYRAVEEMTKRAFWNQHVPGCNEHYLAHILRDSADFLPELDFVAELDGVIVGNIMYTRSKLIAEDGEEKNILTFGPLSVNPEYQRRGIGKALLRHSLEKAAQMGYEAVVIFGNPENYVTSGFRSCKHYGVAMAKDAYPVALLVRELKPGALAGKNWLFEESSAFEIDEAAAEAFDAEFPPMEKGWQPSQELFAIYSRSMVVR